MNSVTPFLQLIDLLNQWNAAQLNAIEDINDNEYSEQVINLFEKIGEVFSAQDLYSFKIRAKLIYNNDVLIQKINGIARFQRIQLNERGMQLEPTESEKIDKLIEFQMKYPNLFPILNNSQFDQMQFEIIKKFKDNESCTASLNTLNNELKVSLSILFDAILKNKGAENGSVEISNFYDKILSMMRDHTDINVVNFIYRFYTKNLIEGSGYDTKQNLDFIENHENIDLIFLFANIAELVFESMFWPDDEDYSKVRHEQLRQSALCEIENRIGAIRKSGKGISPIEGQISYNRLLLIAISNIAYEESNYLLELNQSATEIYELLNICKKFLKSINYEFFFDNNLFKVLLKMHSYYHSVDELNQALKILKSSVKLFPQILANYEDVRGFVNDANPDIYQELIYFINLIIEYRLQSKLNLPVSYDIHDCKLMDIFAIIYFSTARQEGLPPQFKLYLDFANIYDKAMIPMDITIIKQIGLVPEYMAKKISEELGGEVYDYLDSNSMQLSQFSDNSILHFYTMVYLLCCYNSNVKENKLQIKDVLRNWNFSNNYENLFGGIDLKTIFGFLQHPIDSSNTSLVEAVRNNLAAELFICIDNFNEIGFLVIKHYTDLKNYNSIFETLSRFFNTDIPGKRELVLKYKGIANHLPWISNLKMALLSFLYDHYPNSLSEIEKAIQERIGVVERSNSTLLICTLIDTDPAKLLELLTQNRAALLYVINNEAAKFSSVQLGIEPNATINRIKFLMEITTLYSTLGNRTLPNISKTLDKPENFELILRVKNLLSEANISVEEKYRLFTTILESQELNVTLPWLSNVIFSLESLKKNNIPIILGVQSQDAEINLLLFHFGLKMVEVQPVENEKNNSSMPLIRVLKMGYVQLTLRGKNHNVHDLFKQLLDNDDFYSLSMTPNNLRNSIISVLQDICNFTPDLLNNILIDSPENNVLHLLRGGADHPPLQRPYLIFQYILAGLKANKLIYEIQNNLLRLIPFVKLLNSPGISTLDSSSIFYYATKFANEGEFKFLNKYDFNFSLEKKADKFIHAFLLIPASEYENFTISYLNNCSESDYVKELVVKMGYQSKNYYFDFVVKQIRTFATTKDLPYLNILIQFVFENHRTICVDSQFNNFLVVLGHLKNFLSVKNRVFLAIYSVRNHPFISESRIEGRVVSFDFSSLNHIANQLNSLSPPEGIHLGLWREVTQNLYAKVESNPSLKEKIGIVAWSDDVDGSLELTEKEEPITWDVIWTGSLNSPELIQYFKINGRITLIQLKLFYCLKYILAGSPESAPNEFSEREKRLIRFAAIVKTCESAKQKGIVAFYNLISEDPEFAIQAEIFTDPLPMLHDGNTKLRTDLLEFTWKTYQDYIQQLLASTGPLLRRLCELAPNQPMHHPVHQERHALNVIGPSIGYEEGIVVDPHANCVNDNFLRKSHDEIMNIFKEYFSVEGFLRFYSDKINLIANDTESLINPKNRKTNFYVAAQNILNSIDDPSFDPWGYDEESYKIELMPLGAVEICRIFKFFNVQLEAQLIVLQDSTQGAPLYPSAVNFEVNIDVEME
jgi:hypothetical protein